MSNGQGIEAYDSAYPGSMCERKDGAYIRREDANSLANALLALIRSGDRAAEDLQDALDLEKRESADRIAALEAKLADWERRSESCESKLGQLEANEKVIELEAKVQELEDKLRFKQMDCDTWQRDSEGKLEDRTRLEHELTASRQQVERLVEALNGLRSIVRHFWNDDHPEIFALDAACEKADEALAAVEKERHNEELTGAKPVGEASGSAQG